MAVSDTDFYEIQQRLAQDPQHTFPAKRIAGLAAYASRTLDYAEATGDVSVTHTTEGTADTLVAGNAITVDGATAVLLEFFAPAWFNNNNSRTLTVVFTDGTTVLGKVASFNGPANPSDITFPVARYRYTPVAGTYTFTAKVYANTGTNVTVRAGAGGTGAYAPMFLRVSNDTPAA